MIIEIRDRRGRLRTRERVEALPVSIGRSQSADVYVDDETVDGVHARLEMIDADPRRWALVDLESVNGLRVKGQKVVRAELASGDEVRLGRARLRVFSEDHPVAPARLVSDRRSGAVFAASLAGVALLLGTSTLETIFGSWNEIEPAALFSQVLVQLTVLAGWAGLWAFSGRAFVGETRFLEHWAIASVAIAASSIFTAIGGYVSFISLPSESLRLTASLLTDGVIATLALGAHLARVSAMPRNRVRWTAALVSFGLIGITQFSDWSESDVFSGNLSFDGELKPVPVEVLAVVPADDYFGSLSDLQEEIDAAAEEAKAENE